MSHQSAPVSLTTDHLTEPLGLAVERPVLAWKLTGTQSATAYEIEVRSLDPATSREMEPPLWATGRVLATTPATPSRPTTPTTSPTTPATPAGPTAADASATLYTSAPWTTYDGAPLASDTDYTWRVRVWREDETPSPWASARFSTSLLHPAADVRSPWLEPAQTPAEAEPPIDFAAVFSEDGHEHVWESAGERLHPVKLIRQELCMHAPAPRTTHTQGLDQDSDHSQDSAQEPRLARARLYTCAQGVLDLSIDGHPVGDHVLAPGWTSYQDYAELEVHDVTEALSSPGPHVLGARLADGWFAGRTGALGESVQYGTLLRLWWQLSLTWSDGTTSLLGPDLTARCTEDGPLRYSDILVGEMRDDLLASAVALWDTPRFDEAASFARWSPVRLLSPVERPDDALAPLDPPTRLEPFRGEPARRVMELAVAQVITTPAGETVLDLGQVIAGRVRLSAVGSAGTEIVLEHSEHLAKDGTFFSNVVGPNKDQRDVWVLAGTGTPQAPEVFEPAFTFHGFRYCKVSGYPGELTTQDAVGVVIASDLPATGSFSCSESALTRLHENVVWSQRANFLWIPTDCPQRERTGWTGDAQVFASAATNNAEVHTFLSRWLRNVRADQRPDGSVMNISPWPPLMSAMEGIPGPGGIVTSAGWGDAVIRVPLALYERYGDTTVLAENLEAMRAWVDLQSRQAAEELPEHLRREAGDPTSGWEDLEPEHAARQRLLWSSRTHFGDWLTPSTLVSDAPLPIMEAPRRTSAFVGSAFHAEALRTLARAEEALGNHEQAHELREHWEAVRQAVTQEYVSPAGAVSSGLQGEQVLALALDLVPDAGLRTLVAERLADLVSQAGNHLDTGFLSTPFLLDTLLDSGHEEQAWAVLLQDTLPSWLYEVRQGATTIWESWAAVAPDGSVGTMSLNHYSLGAVDDVLYRRVAGIAPAEPGFRRVRVAPLVNGPLTWARAVRETPYGEVSVSWSRRGAPGSPVRYEVGLPAGVHAELVGPDGSLHELAPGQSTLTL